MFDDKILKCEVYLHAIHQLKVSTSMLSTIRLLKLYVYKIIK